MKNKIIAISLLIVVLLTGCKKEKKVDEIYAGIIVEYVNFYNKQFDKKIVQLQKSLKLTSKQVEILYLAKGDLLSTVPDFRKMVFKLQMQFSEILAKEEATLEDMEALEEHLDVYNNILRDTIGKRTVEFHATLNQKQKEKLAHYIERGKFMYMPVKTMPLHQLCKPVMKLSKNMKLKTKQIVAGAKTINKSKKEIKKHWKIVKKDLKNQRKSLKTLVLSDSIELSQLDEISKYNIKLLRPFKIETEKVLLEITKTLTKKQKEHLIKFISEYNFL